MLIHLHFVGPRPEYKIQPLDFLIVAECWRVIFASFHFGLEGIYPRSDKVGAGPQSWAQGWLKFLYQDYRCQNVNRIMNWFLIFSYRVSYRIVSYFIRYTTYHKCSWFEKWVVQLYVAATEAGKEMNWIRSRSWEFYIVIVRVQFWPENDSPPVHKPFLWSPHSGHPYNSTKGYSFGSS